MKPTKDIILIEADEPVTKTTSGLLIQEDWKTLPPIGTVLEIGPDVTLVKKGDRVVFERYGAIKLEKQHRFCKERHLLAIITDGN